MPILYLESFQYLKLLFLFFYPQSTFVWNMHENPCCILITLVCWKSSLIYYIFSSHISIIISTILTMNTLHHIFIKDVLCGRCCAKHHLVVSTQSVHLVTRELERVVVETAINRDAPEISNKRLINLGTTISLLQNSSSLIGLQVLSFIPLCYITAWVIFLKSNVRFKALYLLPFAVKLKSKLLKMSYQEAPCDLMHVGYWLFFHHSAFLL